MAQPQYFDKSFPLCYFRAKENGGRSLPYTAWERRWTLMGKHARKCLRARVRKCAVKGCGKNLVRCEERRKVWYCPCCVIASCPHRQPQFARPICELCGIEKFSLKIRGEQTWVCSCCDLDSARCRHRRQPAARASVTASRPAAKSLWWAIGF